MHALATARCRNAEPARGTIVATLALVVSSFAPVALGLAGELYLTGVILLGAFVVAAAVRFGDGTSKPRARQLLAVSLFYLPLMLALFALNTFGVSGGSLGGPF